MSKGTVYVEESKVWCFKLLHFVTKIKNNNNWWYGLGYHFNKYAAKDFNVFWFQTPDGVVGPLMILDLITSKVRWGYVGKYERNLNQNKFLVVSLRLRLRNCTRLLLFNRKRKGRDWKTMTRQKIDKKKSH